MRRDPWHQGDPNASDPQVRIRRKLEVWIEALESAQTGGLGYEDVTAQVLRNVIRSMQKELDDAK